MHQDIRELFFIVLVFAGVFAGVQWLLLKFLHWSIALGFTGLVAFVIAFLYVSLKHPSPNGGSQGPDGSEFITPSFVVFVVLFCAFAGVAYFSKIHLPRIAYIFPIGLVVVLAFGNYGYGYVNDMTAYASFFSRCDIRVLNESGSETIIREISFSSDEGVSTMIDPASSEAPYPYLARNASRISFRCISPKNGRMFFQEFPFDYKLCQEKDGERMGFCFWLREKVVLPVKLIIRSGNNVSLFVGDKLFKDYQLKEEKLQNE